MALFDWETHRLHRLQKIKDEGVWIGLLNEDGIPICDMPPATAMNAPATRLEPGSFTMTVPLVGKNGTTHRVADELIADGISTDSTGALVPDLRSTRFIAFEREGETRDSRRTFKVGFPKSDGSTRFGPETMTLDGMSELDLLGGLIAPSDPDTWDNVWILSDRDWAGPWSKERWISDIKTAAVATGFTLAGPAESTIRELISRSLAACYRIDGITSVELHPIRVSPLGTGLASPNVVLRPSDDTILNTVVNHAAAAGVRISAHMWMPGDTWQHGIPNLSLPTVVVFVEQMVGVN